MKPTVIIKVPGPGGIAILKGIPAVRWRKELRTAADVVRDRYLFEGADGNITAEFPADVVLAISFDGTEDDIEGDRATLRPYSAMDLLNTLIDWYDEEFGPDPEDIAGAVVAIVPLYYAAGVLFGLDKEGAKSWVKQELRRVHDLKNP